MVMVVVGVGVGGGSSLAFAVCCWCFLCLCAFGNARVRIGGRVRFSRCGPCCGERVDRSRWFRSESCALLWLSTTELQADEVVAAGGSPMIVTPENTSPEAAGRFV